MVQNENFFRQTTIKKIYQRTHWRNLKEHFPEERRELHENLKSQDNMKYARNQTSVFNK